MAELTSLLFEHTAATQAMTRLLVNLKKLGRSKFTPQILQTRLNVLNITWTECKALHVKIHLAATTEQQRNLPYFTDEEFLVAETIYLEVNDYITAELQQRTPPTNTNTPAVGNGTSQDEKKNSVTPLPRIDMPKFSGSYTDWVSFRDLFQSLIMNYDSLPNVHKLHYLKISVTGEASSLLKTIAITEANLEIAWNKLKDRYENSLHIIDSYLTKLFDVNAVIAENVKDLK